MSSSRLGQIRHGPGGGVSRIIATAESTHNTFFAFEEMEPPGGGTPLHCHMREDEFFYVIEGELTLFVDGKRIVLGAGQSQFAPRNVPHCFKNCSGRPVKFLVFCTPPGIEAFFDYGMAGAGGEVPSDDKLIENIMRLAPGFGLQILGPSPL